MSQLDKAPSLVTMIKKHILAPAVIGVATLIGYIGYRLKGYRHAIALYMVNELKASKGL